MTRMRNPLAGAFVDNGVLSLQNWSNPNVYSTEADPTRDSVRRRPQTPLTRSVLRRCVRICFIITSPRPLMSFVACRPYNTIRSHLMLRGLFLFFCQTICVGTQQLFVDFVNNYVFWPHKVVLFSYEVFENNTNPVDLYFGACVCVFWGTLRLKIFLCLST